MNGDGSAEYGLVMPFVSVASKGGPHDDDSYVAGYEMGLLAGRLERQASMVNTTIHAVNAGQADLIAMQHGYRAEFEDSGTEDWQHLRLARLDMIDGVNP